MLWFLESGAQGWLFVARHSLQSSKFCDVCGVSLFSHSSTDLVIDFSSIFINHRFSPVKMAIRGWPSRIYLHLEGFKLPLWDTPVAHQIVAGNSISVTWGSNGSVPTMACFRYCFCWPSLVRFVEFIVFLEKKTNTFGWCWSHFCSQNQGHLLSTCAAGVCLERLCG